MHWQQIFHPYLNSHYYRYIYIKPLPFFIFTHCVKLRISFHVTLLLHISPIAGICCTFGSTWRLSVSLPILNFKHFLNLIKRANYLTTGFRQLLPVYLTYLECTFCIFAKYHLNFYVAWPWTICLSQNKNLKRFFKLSSLSIAHFPLAIIVTYKSSSKCAHTFRNFENFANRAIFKLQSSYLPFWNWPGMLNSNLHSEPRYLYCKRRTAI